jgi:hypothetical protein
MKKGETGKMNKECGREISYLAEYAIKRGKEFNISAIEYLTSDKYDWEEFDNFLYHKLAYEDFIKDKLGKWVYFLLKDNKIVYIGKSVCLYNRLMVHKSTNKYDFDSITYFDYSKTDITDEELLVIENFFINQNI